MSTIRLYFRTAVKFTLTHFVQRNDTSKNLYNNLLQYKDKFKDLLHMLEKVFYLTETRLTENVFSLTSALTLKHNNVFGLTK